MFAVMRIDKEYKEDVVAIMKRNGLTVFTDARNNNVWVTLLKQVIVEDDYITIFDLYGHSDYIAKSFIEVIEIKVGE